MSLAKLRRETAKQNLEAQLLRGNKPEKVDGKTTDKHIPLSTHDIERINREIGALNNPKKKTA